MRIANLTTCFDGNLATLNNRVSLRQTFIYQNVMYSSNLIFGKKFELRYKTCIIPLGLCEMELNSNKYKLFEAFLILIFRQLNLNFFLYKGLRFSKFMFDEFYKDLNKKVCKIII